MSEYTKATARKCGALCDKCAFSVIKAQGFVGPESTKNPLAAIVAEAPGGDECTSGQPLVGLSGQEAMKALRQHGLKRTDVHLTNAVLCRPSGNRMDKVRSDLRKINEQRALDAKEPLLSPIVACRPRLINELKEEGITNIIAMGGVALEALTGTRISVTSARGAPLEPAALNPGLRIFPTLHPAFILRAQRWRHVFYSDVGRAFRWFNGTLGWKEPKVLYKPSIEQIIKYLRKHKSYIVDVETDAIKPLRAKLRCIGIGTSETCIVIPLLSIDGVTHFYPRHEEIQIAKIVRDFLLDPSIQKVGHNFGSYDLLVLGNRLKFERIANLLDTLLIHRSVEPEMPHSLAYCGSVYTDIDRAWKAEHTAVTAQTDQELGLYNATDVCVNARIQEPLTLLAKTRNQWPVVELDHKLQQVCVDMHRTGLLVDPVARDKHDKQLLADAIKFRKLCRDSLDNKKFNPASVLQIRDLLYNDWQLPIINRTQQGLGDPSTDDDTIRALMLEPGLSKTQKVFLSSLRMFRRRSKLRGTYIVKLKRVGEVYQLDENAHDEEDEAWQGARSEEAEWRKRDEKKEGIIDPDGRIRSSWNVHGTNTGRFSSSSPNCFDAQTEVLTKRGWVMFPELLETDKVAQWEDGYIDFVSPTSRISFPYSGCMVSLKNQHADLRATADHRCLLFSRHRNGSMPEVVKAIDYKSDRVQLHAGEYLGGDGLPLTDDQIRLLVAMQADGSWRAQSSAAMDFAFDKKRKQDRLRMLLQNTGAIFTERQKYLDGSRPTVRFGAINQPITDLIYSYLGKDKLFGSWILDMTFEQLEVFAKEAFLWDGLAVRQTNYSSSIKNNVDWMQIAHTLLNWRSKVRVYMPPSGTPNYQTDITQNRNYSMTTNIEKMVDTVLDEMVYCVSVPSSFVVVRRNGLAVVTGNCQNFPRRLRNMIIPEDGHCFVYADMDQLELRLVTMFSGAKVYADVFAAGGDPHSTSTLMVMGKQGEAIYNKAVAIHGSAKKARKLDKDWERCCDFGKRFTYAAVYQAAIETILEVLRAAEDDQERLIYADLDIAKCQMAYDNWLGKAPEIVQWWEACIKRYRERGFAIEAMTGRRCDFADGENANQIINFDSQACGAGIVNTSTLEFVDAFPRNKLGPYTGLCQQGHDALLAEAPIKHGEATRKLLEKCMNKRVPGFDMEFTASAKIIQHWGQA